MKPQKILLLRAEWTWELMQIKKQTTVQRSPGLEPQDQMLFGTLH